MSENIILYLENQILPIIQLGKVYTGEFKYLIADDPFCAQVYLADGYTDIFEIHPKLYDWHHTVFDSEYIFTPSALDSIMQCLCDEYHYMIEYNHYDDEMWSRWRLINDDHN